MSDSSQTPLVDRRAGWPVVRSRDVHRDDWVVVVREDVITRPGHPEHEFARITVEHPGAVIVLHEGDESRAAVAAAADALLLELQQRNLIAITLSELEVVPR